MNFVFLKHLHGFPTQRRGDAERIFQPPRLCVSVLKFLIFFFVFFPQYSIAQTLEVKINVSPETSKVSIEGKVPNARKDWVFIDSYANANNLAARIENIKLFNGQSEKNFKRQISGVFTTEAEVNRFTCDVRLDFPANVAQAAHISWLTEERGLIQLGDVLPEKSPLKSLLNCPQIGISPRTKIKPVTINIKQRILKTRFF
jgi:hypothetical protein